jgi:CheY-like chemotaxis protein
MNVFFLDDDEDDLELFADAVREIDGSIIITTCSNPTLAFEYLNSEIPNHIFLDINMPLMNGIDFLEVLRNQERYNKVPVTFLSTSPKNSNPYKLDKLNAGYLQKPPKFDQLVSMLKETIGC